MIGVAYRTCEQLLGNQCLISLVGFKPAVKNVVSITGQRKLDHLTSPKQFRPELGILSFVNIDLSSSLFIISGIQQRDSFKKPIFQSMQHHGFVGIYIK